MSFDLFYQPGHFGAEPVERKNPFTGEVESSLPIQSLSVVDQEKVRRVLAGAGARGPDEFGCFVVDFDDSGVAEVFASDLGTGCMAATRGLSPDLLKFLFDLLKSADWVLLPAMEGNPAIVSSPGLAIGFADNFPEVVCASPEELGAILSGGFEAWEKYRDRVGGSDRT